jgi:hypothetical protein
MIRKNLLGSLVLGAAFACGSAAFAQIQNINPQRHPNLAAAQASIAHASEHIDTAQRDTHGRFGGHAEKAKELLARAAQELKEGAEYNNHHSR